MAYARSHVDDVQAISIASSRGAGTADRDAETSLRQVHRDLPEMVTFSSTMLAHSEIDVGASRATSHRLVEALMRGLAMSPEGRLSEMDKGNVERTALRSVLVQEAAAHELRSRTGEVDPLGEFMGDRSQVNGVKAMSTLERQGVDTVALYGQSTDADLVQMSLGSFDRTSQAQQVRSAKALEVPLERISTVASGSQAVETSATKARVLPIRGAFARMPMAQARHTPSFGRRQQPHLAAGQGI